MLNPDNNLYSVAPVGNVVIIGRQAALKGGLTRENAMNLLVWLALATNAKPEEISNGIAAACMPSTPIKPTVTILPQVVVPQHPTPAAAVQAFIGEVDAEEQAALDEVKAACATAEAIAPTPAVPPVPPAAVLPPDPAKRTAPPVPTTPARGQAAVAPPKPVVVDEEAMTKAWGVKS